MEGGREDKVMGQFNYQIELRKREQEPVLRKWKYIQKIEYLRKQESMRKGKKWEWSKMRKMEERDDETDEVNGRKGRGGEGSNDRKRQKTEMKWEEKEC